MPEGMPTDAAVLAGNLPPLVVQRQALPVRNGKIGLAPLSCDGAPRRFSGETSSTLGRRRRE
jgi:hypothetical protein